ncbi:MAG: phosphoribosylamine--glycine ligase [Chloroflexota bacterium]
MATDAQPRRGVGMSFVMPTRILVVGGGGREHALAWKLGSEPGVNEVIVAPGSDAIAAEPRTRCVPISPLDPDSVVDVARREAVELAVIGPEVPLAVGVVDGLIAAGVPTFGPTRDAARIETSKAFCRSVADAAGVPVAGGEAFDEAGAAMAFAHALAATAGVVVKADGLAGGKGVVVCADVDEAEAAIERLSAESRVAGPFRVVVERRLDGREASCIALCDGRDAIALPAARDHKRLGDGDTGPNTGGMGASSPLPDLPDELAEAIVDRFHRPILAELARRGTPFRGALYAGLMLTADGPVLLECNARFGDPETQVLVPRLGVPLGPLLLAAARGQLAGAVRPLAIDRRVPCRPGAAVGIVLASAGYPHEPRTGERIDGLDDARAAGALVFHSGTVRDPNGRYATSGGRVLTIVGQGDDLAAAHRHAESAAELVRFAGLQRRHDIGLEPQVAGVVG